MSDEKKPTPDAEAKKPAEETKPAAEAAAAPAKPSSASSPWLPVLVVIIILPILSFVVTDMVMIPRVKKALGEIATLQTENAHPAAGGHEPAPTAAKPKKEAKKAASAHGGGGHGEAAAPAEAGVKFENVVANLSGSMKSRFVKVSFTIEGDQEDFAEVIKASKVKIIDSALGILGALTVAELEEPGMKNIVRSDLISGFNQALKGEVVQRLYFSEFVIQ
jgi:flagellar protein FliL